MKRDLPILIAAILVAAAPPATAQGRSGCPPGLAKKDPPCIPPGHAKAWHMGERYDGPWTPFPWRRHDIPRPAPGETWGRVGDDVIIRVNDETRAVIDIIRLADVVLSN
jgi:hypothetical protein